MRFVPTKIAGVMIVELEEIHDERGFFARVWCADEFARHGLNPRLTQCNISFNDKAGTVRGMHYQAAPHEEAKLVRVTRGAIVDVALDLRPDSPTHRQHVAVELTADNRRALYIPDGCAHGFQTLEDNTELFYLMSTPFHAASARGVRHDDPAFNITWPRPITMIAAKDLQFASYTP
jgi:dTDP-4-dehydrorhamnose 3,5-epimerase